MVDDKYHYMVDDFHGKWLMIQSIYFG